MWRNKYMLQDKTYIEEYDGIDNLQPVLEECLDHKESNIEKGPSS